MDRTPPLKECLMMMKITIMTDCYMTVTVFVIELKIKTRAARGPYAQLYGTLSKECHFVKMQLHSIGT